MGIRAIIYKAGIKGLRLFWRLVGGRRITVFGHNLVVASETIFPDYRKLRLPKGDCFSQIVRYADYVQMHSICSLVSGLHDQPVIIDVGAHHGAYALMIGQIVRAVHGKVIAIEPNPRSYEILKRNVQSNGLEDVILCEQVAVSDRAGSMNLLLADDQSHMTTFQTDLSVPVDVVTLKWILDRHRIDAVDLMIIDVEGAELPVLKGFPWGVAKVDKIFCELHPYAWEYFHYSGEEMRQFLLAHNYRCFDMYFREHVLFDGDAYIGPTLFIRESRP